MLTDPEVTIGLLRRLVGFPTVTSGSNLDLIDFVHDRLSAADAVSVTTSPDGARANLLARFGPPVAGGVVLSGHTDVVPADAGDWQGDPFAAELRDGRVVGRGACDMKGFLACLLAMAPTFATARLARPVHLAFTFDEEVGCQGAPLLIADLLASGPAPAAAIVGEPTGMRIIDAHKGCYEYTTEITGLDGHASRPEAGVDAIRHAVAFISRLQQLGDRLRDRAPAAGVFDPPHSTVSVGRISGGVARNVIAAHCSFDWELRSVQPADVGFVTDAVAAMVDTELLPAMRARHPDADVRTVTVGAVGGLEPRDDSPAVALAQDLTGQAGTEAVAFGTEAGLYQQAGIPAVVCGPGDISQAHVPEESIGVDQLVACLELLTRLVGRLTTSGG